MHDSPWLHDAELRELLREVVARAVKQYRLSEEDAEPIVHEALASHAALRKVLESRPAPGQLKRSRAFKQATSEAKRQVYYRLRTYQAAGQDDGAAGELLAGLADQEAPDHREQARREALRRHASTRERLSAADAFYDQLFRLLEPPRSILDVGCGVHPLMFPYEHPGAARLRQYVAIDKSASDIGLVKAFAEQLPAGLLSPRVWQLSDGWGKVLESAGADTFDLALLMKVAAVVHRQQRPLLDILAETPAETWLVTGSRVSLTRRVSIERRERRVLRQFVEAAGREVRAEFIVGEEFAWIVRPARPTDTSLKRHSDRRRP